MCVCGCVRVPGGVDFAVKEGKRYHSMVSSVESLCMLVCVGAMAGI